MSSFEPIVALQRGLDVLAIVNRGAGVSLKTIHDETGLHKATIIRMLDTLIASGYVARMGRSSYAATGRTLQLSLGYDSNRRIAHLAEPLISKFRMAVGWPSDIAVYSEGSMVVVQTSRERGPLYFARHQGYRAPVLVTSIGLAYLAFCPQTVRDTIIAALSSNANATDLRARDREALDRKLVEVRDQGYAVMHESYSEREYRGRIWGFAVPVKDHQHVYAAMNILLLKDVISNKEAISRFLRPLQEVAQQIGEAIGNELSASLVNRPTVAQDRA